MLAALETGSSDGLFTKKFQPRVLVVVGVELVLGDGFGGSNGVGFRH